MFEISAWCIVVSVVLTAAVWLDGRRHQPLWRLPAIVWAVVVGVTWIGIIPYAAARARGRTRRPVTVGVR